MTVARYKTGWTVKHCHGADKGKPMTKKPISKKKAVAMHRAIAINKKKRGK